ncbi:hypothetical protein, partial [Nonomuraea sp. KM90]|uniref:hypothetical protein n=1 Tax=Nonomuraea sp. KM90 TaxID=3457428 RepID=UPI003FCC8400
AYGLRSLTRLSQHVHAHQLGITLQIHSITLRHQGQGPTDRPLRAELRNRTIEIRQLQTEAIAYDDALHDIVSQASQAEPSSSSDGRVADILGIAQQVLASRSYPGRLRAAQEALERAESELHELRTENLRLAEMAVGPRESPH